MKSGCPSCALAAASSNVLGISHRKITLISTSIWAIPARSSAPIALRYSVSIRARAHANPIRQTVLTVTWSEKDGAALARFGVQQLRVSEGFEWAGGAVENVPCEWFGHSDSLMQQHIERHWIPALNRSPSPLVLL